MRSEYTDRNLSIVLENYQTFENESDELVHVFVNGEEIITTPSHPFYVPKFGWTSAIKLRAGDILVLSNGEYVVVETVQHEILENPIKVYNFEVEDFHTYFVGEWTSANCIRKLSLYLSRTFEPIKLIKGEMIVFKINIRIVEDLEILKTMDISDFDKEYNQIEGFFQICMGSHKEGCYYHEDELQDGEIGSEVLNYWLNRLLDVVNCFSNGEEYVAFHELETMNRWLEFKASEGEIQIRTAIDSSMKIKDP